MTNWTEEVRALADLAEMLILAMIEEIAQPDIRQMQALHLITEAGQQLYAASINLKPDSEPDEVGDDGD
ncbi:hypothetical protein [Candidatus Methylomicrobium oryzae]|uniref:hypothetical protein n=1 Tax=Candidatus Methylomicrobium oryzae TaxID=2802053 RepID=UPI0019244554|nr:hypothetical protein [Methylomicrobium sp. RS1]MBL1263924.1 hypothetical protein [Methylomicrobium sp. RS1]